ncbi:hypothetical protein BZA70DRAFT_167708 [Myxozyma melibiosi]|uniref:Uncharacterized protein n=1 Tax=Myxozyma melibiosi TaxID=54550 RepID=A0ABR1F573_9ASCO
MPAPFLSYDCSRPVHAYATQNFPLRSWTAPAVAAMEHVLGPSNEYGSWTALPTPDDLEAGLVAVRRADPASADVVPVQLVLELLERQYARTVILVEANTQLQREIRSLQSQVQSWPASHAHEHTPYPSQQTTGNPQYHSSRSEFYTSPQQLPSYTPTSRTHGASPSAESSLDGTVSPASTTSASSPTASTAAAVAAAAHDFAPAHSLETSAKRTFDQITGSVSSGVRLSSDLVAQHVDPSIVLVRPALLESVNGGGIDGKLPRPMKRTRKQKNIM